MGGGSWDTGRYKSATTTRAATGKKDFDYSSTAYTVHESLKASRISKKIHGVLESRDADGKPASLPVMLFFDVTGSNAANAEVAQKKLPILMELLNKYVPGVQLAVGANDDYLTSSKDCIQISEFESDNRVDEHLRNIWLISRGGGNDGESYDLALYAAARKVKTDSFEKRGKKGYLFLYADEPIFDHVSAPQVQAVFGDKLQADIPIVEMIEEVRRAWHVFIVFPDDGYKHAKEQYLRLFGEDSVIVSQSPDLLAELVASTVALYEGSTDHGSLVTDLVAVGASKNDAESTVNALVKSATHASSVLTPSGAGKAARL